ncbi:MAG: hypothetical protein ABWY64_21530 [Tardiphaga sp.]
MMNSHADLAGYFKTIVGRNLDDWHALYGDPGIQIDEAAINTLVAYFLGALGQIVGTIPEEALRQDAGEFFIQRGWECYLVGYKVGENTRLNHEADKAQEASNG